MTDQNQEKDKPGFFAVIGSVLAAMIGVQSEENRERDFSKGDIRNYIFVGIIMVAVFIFVLIRIVDSIIASS